MNGRSDATPPSSAEPYSPQLRTALVLTGTGTAGAYHAGVLRALHEAGVKLDVVAGRGIGVIGALFSAIDGAQRLWERKGFWRAPGLRSLYNWRFVARVAVWALGLSLAVVAIPLATIAAGLVVFPLDFLLRLLGLGGAEGLVGDYLRFAQAAFAPTALPTWLPRLVFLVLAAATGTAAVYGWRRPGRRGYGAAWWRLVPAPLSAGGAVHRFWGVLWDLLRGAAQLKQPAPSDLARRYVEVLSDNLGQPGFRELVLVAHDLDAHSDLVFSLVAQGRRRDLLRRPTTEAAELRRAELIDLSGVGRDYLVDAVAAALAVPIVTEPHPIVFAPDAYWRGETHRLCDRPSALARLLDELVGLGVQQIVMVSAAPESPRPHTLTAPRLDGRSRLGEYLQSSEAAAVRDATRMIAARAPRVFNIRPTHNPIGPFDFDGGYDDRSDRTQPLDELMSRGYEDAYHQFIEPVIGASGERVGREQES
ncbi:MAG TPA: patatin-like phospholipase family protein [Vicinamibacterales bacterium]|nr:patatin-like phospholipase family protein [Vicinamibacterales bacterium]